MTAKARVLVVEDDQYISRDICESLEGFGYEIAAAVQSGEEAISKAVEVKPDLVLMDINLKGKLDGIQAAEMMHQKRPLPLVFLTALADETTLQRAKLAVPYGYLIKPFDPTELHSTIEIALHRFSVESGKPAYDTQQEAALADISLEAETSAGAVEKTAILERIEPLRSLSKPAVQSLANLSEIITCNAGEFIHIEENDPERAFIVLTGRISIIKTSASGKDLILSLLGPGDCFGMLYLLPEFGKVASARAQLDSKLLSFPRSHFTQLRTTVPELMDALTVELTSCLSTSYQLAMSLAHSRVETRILSTLVALVSTLAKSSPKSQNEARIFITRKELADLTGTTPETAIRVTKQLERDGVLELSRPGIIKVPDLTKLRSLARDAAAA